MIVLGADMHKASHTLAAVVAATGEMLGDTTIVVGSSGFEQALGWARELGLERVWALEDCRPASLLLWMEAVAQIAPESRGDER